MKGLTMLLTIFLALFLAFPASAGSKTPLTVLVEGFENNQGQVMVQVTASRKAFEGDAPPTDRKMAPIKKGKAKVVFYSLKPGTYAVSLYHDANANQKMDKNFLGVPKEDYGFSNNARGTMGPPDWDKAKFELGSEAKTLTITVD